MHIEMEGWNQNLEKLKNFRSVYGHYNVPKYWQVDKRLSQWVINIRESKNSLPSKLLKELEEMGFSFEIPKDGWDEMYSKLHDFYLKHGHTILSLQEEDLYQWTKLIRQNKGKLSAEQIRKLDDIQFDWVLRYRSNEGWEKMYEELKAYRNTYGTGEVPSKDPQYKRLWQWIFDQRRIKDTMHAYRKEKLDQIGFDWDGGKSKMYEERWTDNYQKLKAYKEAHGHMIVPYKDPAFKQLRTWMSTQRINVDQLSEDRKQKLDLLGFNWTEKNKQQKADNWNLMYKKLSEFHKANGHIRVSKQQDRKLNRWLRAQEERANISPEKKAKLDALGMKWVEENKKEREKAWNKMYNELRAFYLQNGDCCVPIKEKKLYQFITGLRQWNKTLSDDQKKKLSDIGFDLDWERRKFFEQYWEKRYNELKDFKKLFGHCKPSKRKGDYTSLGLWVQDQRKNKDKLSEEQKGLLDELGFEWRKIDTI